MINVDKKKCNGCGLCRNKCMFGAISIVGKQAVINDACVLCGACFSVCPTRAISIDLQQKTIGDFSDYEDIWVIMQLDERTRQPKKVSYELLSEARKLSDRLGQRVVAVCLCHTEPEEFRSRLKEVGCDELLLVENEHLLQYDTEIFTDVVSGLIRGNKPAVVLFAATEDGRDLAPRVSARLKVGLTADCTALDIDEDNRLIQIRPTYGGNIMASIITPDHRPQMASVRPNVFKVNNHCGNRKLTVTKKKIEIDDADKRIIRTGFRKKEVVYKDVSEAEIIIAGGYGVGSENFSLLHKLAIMTGAVVGASRKAVDEGWAPFELQIGQTGKTVAPNLYIACGISGALQHSIGIKNAKRIIAINNDPAAPIFLLSDVAILGDVRQILLRMIEIADKHGKYAYNML